MSLAGIPEIKLWNLLVHSSLEAPCGAPILEAVSSFVSLLHRGISSAFIISAAGRARILLASREECCPSVLIFLALIKRGCLESSLWVLISAARASLLRAISGGVRPDSLYRI